MVLSAILSATVILFTVIDIPGTLPVLIDMKRNGVIIKPLQATLVAGFLMLGFLIFGASMLAVFGIDISSFAIAGSIIIFFIGLEMVLGIQFFRDLQESGGSGTIVPVAFPFIAGAGTLTTIISLKAEFDSLSIISGILINLLLVFLVLRSAGWLSNKISNQVLSTLRKIFGILLLAISIQMFKSNLM